LATSPGQGQQEEKERTEDVVTFYGDRLPRRGSQVSGMSVICKLAIPVHICFNGCAPEYLAEFCHPSVDRRPGN